MIIFALRHADRTAADDLSPAGRERAELLARMLAETGVSIAYRSDAVRAARTLERLERAGGAHGITAIRDAYSGFRQHSCQEFGPFPSCRRQIVGGRAVRVTEGEDDHDTLLDSLRCVQCAGHEGRIHA